MNNEHPNCFGNVKEFVWTDAFYNKEFESFFNLFHPNVTQSASTSPYVFFGRKKVAETFTWASEFYARCDFLHQASSESLEFLEFDLTTVNGMHMTGMTVLTKNKKGEVIKVFNGHRNLCESVIFTEHFVKGPKGKGTVALFHNKAKNKYGLTLKYPRDQANIQASKKVTEQQYIEAFQLSSQSAFIQILDKSVELSASYVSKTIKGIDNVSQCLAIMSEFYEHCIFTSEATFQNRTYLLYKGKLRNDLSVSDGFLILIRNKEGKISQVFDNPIPLHAGTIISSFIAEHIDDKSFAKQYLYNEFLFQDAVNTYSLDKVHGSKTQDLSSIKGFIAQFIIQV